MSISSTPITTELEAISASLEDRARHDRPLGAAELHRAASLLQALSGKVARIERFHADMVAEAQEDDLRRPVLTEADAANAAFLDNFHRVWNPRPC